MPRRWILQCCRTTSIALRGLLLQREAEHAAELQAARNGLKEQVLRNEQLKLRLAKLLRERFGASSEKLRSAIEQFEFLLGDTEEQIAETTPPEPEQPAAATEARRRVASLRAGRCPKHCRAMWWSMPRPAPVRVAVARCIRWAKTSPKCWTTCRAPSVSSGTCGRSCPAAAARRSPRHPRRACRSIAAWPPGLLAHVLVAKYCDHLPLYRKCCAQHLR